jgi:hypothetical protein
MERSSDLELLQKEVDKMGGVASRFDTGLMALHRARLEEEEAAKKLNAQSRNPDGSFALDGQDDAVFGRSDKKSISGIGEMMNIRLGDWDQEDGLNPLLHTLMDGLYDVNVTNALSDIVDPLRDVLRDDTHDLIRRLDDHHKEDMMWQAMQLGAMKGGANKNVGSPFQRMYLLWNNFMRQPFWNSVNLAMRGFKAVLSPIASSFNHVLFGDRTAQSDTDRIVTAIDKQTQLIRNGVIIDKMPYEDMHKYGLIGGSAKWLGEKALSAATFGKVSRKNAQNIENDRASKNRGLNSFEDFLTNRMFTVNRRQTNLGAGENSDPNESVVAELKTLNETSGFIDKSAEEAAAFLREIHATVADIKMLMQPPPSVSGAQEQASSAQRGSDITSLLNRSGVTAANDSSIMEEVIRTAQRNETRIVDIEQERRRQKETTSSSNVAETTRTQLVAGSDVVPVTVAGSRDVATASLTNSTSVPITTGVEEEKRQRSKVEPITGRNGPSGSRTPTTAGESRPAAQNSTIARHESARNAFARKHNVESLDTQIDLQTAANDEQEQTNKISKKMLKMLEKLHGMAVLRSFLNVGRTVGSIISGAFDKLTKMLGVIGSALGVKSLAKGIGKNAKTAGKAPTPKVGGAAASGARSGVLGRLGGVVARGASMGGMGGVYGIAAAVVAAMASDIIVSLIPQESLNKANGSIEGLTRSILDMSAKFNSWLDKIALGTEGDRNAIQQSLYNMTTEGKRELQIKEERMEQMATTQAQNKARLRIPEGKTVNDQYVPLSTDSKEYKENVKRYYEERNELQSKGIKGRMDERGRWVPMKDSNGNPVRLDGTRPEMEAVNPPLENSSPKPLTDGTSALGGAVANTVDGVKNAAGKAKAKVGQAVAGGRSMFDRLMEKMTIAESGGRQHNKDGSVVKSNVGATGVLQIMPKTGPDAAKMAGLPWDKYRFDHDIDYNRALGIAYMQNLMRKYNGDAVLSTAAYNWGMGNVDNLIGKIGDPRTGVVDYGQWIRHLPRETYNYVKKTALAANDEARAGIGNAKNYLASVGANVKTGMVGGYATTISGVQNIASGVKDFSASAPARIADGFKMVSSAVGNSRAAGQAAMANPQYGVNYGKEEAEGQAAASAGAAAAMRGSQITVAQSKPSTPTVDVGPLNTSRDPQVISRTINNNSRITKAAKDNAVASVQTNSMGNVDTKAVNAPAEKPQHKQAPDNTGNTMVKILSSIDNKLGQIASNGNIAFDEGTVLSIFGR